MNKYRNSFLYLTALVTMHFSVGGVPELPVLENVQVASVSAGISPEPQFSYVGFAIEFNNPREKYYRVSFSLYPTNSGVPLRAGNERVDFRHQELVGPGLQVYRDDGGGNELSLTAFDQAGLGHGAPWRYMDVFANAPKNSFYYKARSLTEVLVGYRFQEEDGFHYGWVRFARSDTTFTNIFDLVAHDWHPIPETAIGAGQPPEIPVATEVVDDGAGGSLLRVGWHPAVATWSFETTDSLVPPVTWIEYPAGGTSAEIPLDGEEPQRYFRLRRP